MVLDGSPAALHRYNLKRKIANLPPVTREWFDARKEKLAASSGTALVRTWMDPLTKKKFGSENTYNSYVSSKRYRDMVKQSGQPAPPPLISTRRSEPAPGEWDSPCAW
jgi:pre-60S factor REI1